MSRIRRLATKGRPYLQFNRQHYSNALIRNHIHCSNVTSHKANCYSTLTSQHTPPIELDVALDTSKRKSAAKPIIEDQQTFSKPARDALGSSVSREQIVKSLIADLKSINTNFLNYNYSTNLSSPSQHQAQPLHSHDPNRRAISALDNQTILQKVNLLILTLKSLSNDKLNYPIRVGIKKLSDEPGQFAASGPNQGAEKTLLNSVLADPLSGDQEWYYRFKDRSLSQNNLIVRYNSASSGPKSNPSAQYKVTENVYPHNRQLTLWQIKSPILSASTRRLNFNNLHKIFSKDGASQDQNSSALKLNNLEFLEINNVQKVGNCNVKNALKQEDEEDVLYEFYRDVEEEDEDGQLDIGDGCHLYLYHTDNELMFPLKEVFPYLLVIDSSKAANGKKASDSQEKATANGEAGKSAQGEAPGETQSPLQDKASISKYETFVNHKNLYIDSQLSETANEILIKNFGDTSKYISYLNKSNLLKLIYLLNITTLKHKNVLELLKIINRVVSVKFFNSLSDSNNVQAVKLQELQVSVNNEIQDWSKDANHFLQQEFVQNLNDYEKKKLPWWRLLIVNDDIDYYLADMISASLRSSLPSEKATTANFADSFNYIEGKIDSLVLSKPLSQSQQQNIASESDSLVSKLSAEIINMQNKAIELLTTNLVGIELPAVAVSLFGGYFIYGYDLYSMGAIFALSTAVVCNNISSKWVRLVSEFKARAAETLRKDITDKEQQLKAKWDVAYRDQQTRVAANARVMKSFRKNIALFEKNLGE